MEEKDVLIRNELPTLGLSNANGCHICNQFKLIFEQKDNVIRTKLRIGGVKINGDGHPPCDKYGIKAVPLLKAFSNTYSKSRIDANTSTISLTSSDRLHFFKY